MLRRIRTTKKLARRIDLQYFKHSHPLRRWRFWLSVVVPVVALGWLLAQRAQGGQKAYSSGPLSASHAVFTQQCSLCHVARAGAFFEEVSDNACLACHEGPVHHANQAFTPSCSSCHIEHKGSARLAATSTASCIQCHATLHTRDGQPHFAAAISGFDRTHPEFSPTAKHMKDPSQVRLNHYLHMKPDLVGPNGQRVQMACEDCHGLTGVQDRFPYASDLAQSAASDQPRVARLSLLSATMAPVKFASHCAGCHTLQFDARFAGQQVPHDKPEFIHAFLVKRFQEYITANPAAVHQIEPPSRQVPRRDRPIRIATTAEQWVQFHVDDAEWLLWTKTCKQCHAIKAAGAALPEILPSQIRSRWLEHATFDHHAHRMMSCTSCHAKAIDSHDTADVLLPGIETCRQCHRDQAGSKEVAEGRCFECHQYHDWSKARGTRGRFSIPEIRGTAKLQPLQR